MSSTYNPLPPTSVPSPPFPIFFFFLPINLLLLFSPFLHTPPPPPPTARIHLYTPFPLAFFLFFFCHNVSVCKQNSTKNQQTLVSLFLPSKKPVRKKKSPVSTTSLQNSSKGICHGSLPYLMYFPTCIPRHLLLHRPTCISSSSLSFLQVRKCQLWQLYFYQVYSSLFETRHWKEHAMVHRLPFSYFPNVWPPPPPQPPPCRFYK